MTKRFLYLLIIISLTACHQRQKVVFTDEVRLPMTPVKDQGQTSFCWAYAMLATIETEHIAKGDSVHLSPAYIERVVKRRNLRGMGHTLLNIIGRHGIVSYDAYPDSSYHKLPKPRWVFMLGTRYTPLEFAHSVCAPDEYIALTSTDEHPYYKEVVSPKTHCLRMWREPSAIVMRSVGKGIRMSLVSLSKKVLPTAITSLPLQIITV